MPDLTILLAEDNHLIRMLVRTALRQLQCRVIEVENGREAVAAVESECPDLVLLDITMPEVDGFGVLEALGSREGGIPCPIVMLTTAGSDADVAKARALGAADHILKPFEPAELRNTVAGILGIHP